MTKIILSILLVSAAGRLRAEDAPIYAASTNLLGAASALSIIIRRRPRAFCNSTSPLPSQ